MSMVDSPATEKTLQYLIGFIANQAIKQKLNPETWL